MKRRAIIFEKRGLLGCIAVSDDGRDAHVASFDSRHGVKDAQAFVPSTMAPVVVALEVVKTLERGWRLVYDGEPNFG